MKPTWTVSATLPALGVAATLVFTACSSTRHAKAPLGETTRTRIYRDGVPGGVILETTQIHATVASIDTTNRAITVAVPDGRRRVIGCGPEVVNFDQIRAGDHVHAVIKSELVLVLAGGAMPKVDASIATAALPPRGGQPGGVIKETQEYTATVTSINQRRHEVTLRLPDDTTRTFEVRPDVDLSQRKAGQQVAVRLTVAVAISVEPPGTDSR